jgi:hypothetical protein
VLRVAFGDVIEHFLLHSDMLRRGGPLLKERNCAVEDRGFESRTEFKECGIFDNAILIAHDLICSVIELI